MKEKLDKWRRMRRSLTCDVGTAVNRSRSAISLDMNNKADRFSKRLHLKSCWTVLSLTSIALSLTTVVGTSM